MTINCPFCRSELSDPGITIGRRVQCPYCNEKFNVENSYIRPISHRRVSIVIAAGALLTAAAFLYYYSFCAKSMGKDNGCDIQGEVPTNSFSYVKSKLAIVSLSDIQGSGFVLQMGDKKYLVTNEHVVRGGNGVRPRAILLSGEVLKLGACEVAADRDLIRFEVPSNTVALCMSTEIPEIGDNVVVYGNSDGGGVSTETEGKILGVGGDMIEIDALFVCGNSGSPVVNSHGYVDGVATYATQPSYGEDGWIKRNTRYNNGVRRFATRAVGAPWAPVAWEEYANQVKIYNDIVFFLERLSPYLAVQTDPFSPNMRARYSDKDRLRYTELSRRLHPALLKVSEIYAELEDAYRERVKTENATYQKLSTIECYKVYFRELALECMFNQSKSNALDIAKGILDEANVTMPLFGEQRQSLLNAKQCREAVESEFEAVKASSRQGHIVIARAIDLLSSDGNYESTKCSNKEVGAALIASFIDNGDDYALERFVNFLATDKRKDGLIVAQYVPVKLQHCLELRYHCDDEGKKLGYILGCIAYSKMNYKDAVSYWSVAAEKGMSHPQYLLGVCYENGKGVVLDERTAVEWYKKAAANGLSVAQYNLGVCYATGRGCNRSGIEALRWFRVAADQGEADSQFNVGICYEFGIGVVRNDKDAEKWYRTAIEHGCNKRALRQIDGKCLGLSKDIFGEVGSYLKINLNAFENETNHQEVDGPSNGQLPKSASHVPTASELERSHRQALEARARQIITEARDSMDNKKYEKCAELYIAANKLISELPTIKEFRCECLTGIAEAYYCAARDEWRDGSRVKAIELMKKASLMRRPNAKQELEAMKKEFARDKQT